MIEDAQYARRRARLLRRPRDAASMPGAREIDALISRRLAEGWSLERLDRPMRAILRAGAYELIARARRAGRDRSSPNMSMSPTPSTTSARAGFVNGLLDAIAKEARPRAERLSVRESEVIDRAAAHRHRSRRRAACSTMRRCSTVSSSPTTASPRAFISCHPTRRRASAGSWSR